MKVVRSLSGLTVVLVVYFLLAAVADFAMKSAGVISANGDWKILHSFPEFVCFCLLGMVLGWLWRRIAPAAPSESAELLAVIVAVNAAFAAFQWSTKSPDVNWHLLLLLAVTFPCIWLGGLLAMRHRPPSRT